MGEWAVIRITGESDGRHSGKSPDGLELGAKVSGWFRRLLDRIS